MSFFGTISSFWGLIALAVAAIFVGIVVGQIAHAIVNQKYQPGDLYPLHLSRKSELVFDWVLLSASLTVMVPVAYELWVSYGIVSFKSYIALVVILVVAICVVWYTIRAMPEHIEDLGRRDSYWKQQSWNRFYPTDPET